MPKYLEVQLMNKYKDTDGVEHVIPGALDMQVYQVVSDDGTAHIGYVDLTGQEITIPEVQESRVLNQQYVTPEFLRDV